MLTRAIAASMAAALTLALAPPFAPAAHADLLDKSVKQMLRDLRDAGDQTHGDGVKVALLADGVADVLAKGAHVAPEKDFVRLPDPKREMGTLMASLMVGGEGEVADAGDMTIRGLIRDAELLPVRVQPDDGKSRASRRWMMSGANTDNAVADGLRYAVDHGARVIAVTNAWMYTGSRTYAAIAYAQSKDALVISSVGIRKPTVPDAFAATPGVLGVGAVDKDGDRYAKYTQASSALMVSAYGDKMPGVGSDGSANWMFWGEGPALAFVASAAVMIRAAFPRLTAAQVTQAITSSARNPKGHYTTDLGFGYLSATGALSKAATLAKRPALPETAGETVGDKAHFVAKPPGGVRAVPITLPWFGGFGALIGLGVIAIGAAIWLLARRRPALAMEPALPAAPPLEGPAPAPPSAVPPAEV
ncbi:S8 family serine peptidase [Actinomadura gamaensis]|uniref:S8 family serine peptidase n=1 Tax=Actinomadura gamaensis TaxID=1763541 RepID=A0ABV9TP11_9ACTN